MYGTCRLLLRYVHSPFHLWRNIPNINFGFKLYGGLFDEADSIDINIYADHIVNECRATASKRVSSRVESSSWVYRCIQKGVMVYSKAEEVDTHEEAKDERSPSPPPSVEIIEQDVKPDKKQKLLSGTRLRPGRKPGAP
jgi:hypothetical protein